MEHGSWSGSEKKRGIRTQSFLKAGLLFRSWATSFVALQFAFHALQASEEIRQLQENTKKKLQIHLIGEKQLRLDSLSINMLYFDECHKYTRIYEQFYFSSNFDAIFSAVSLKI